MKKFLSVLLVVLGLSGCSVPGSPPAGEVVTMEGGLEYTILQEGKGAAAAPRDNLRMHYVGTLDDGTVFDSSRERGKPFNFTLGGGQVIEGWDKGVVGMKVGEVRTLTIPPEMGYGSHSVGPIPSNSTLTFEVELIENLKNAVPGVPFKK